MMVIMSPLLTQVIMVWLRNVVIKYLMMNVCVCVCVDCSMIACLHLLVHG